MFAWTGGSATANRTYGALSVLKSSGYTGTVGGERGYFGAINFNASNSNSIYGNSDNVTPINLTIRIWKRIS